MPGKYGMIAVNTLDSYISFTFLKDESTTGENSMIRLCITLTALMIAGILAINALIDITIRHGAFAWGLFKNDVLGCVVFLIIAIIAANLGKSKPEV